MSNKYYAGKKDSSWIIFEVEMGKEPLEILSKPYYRQSGIDYDEGTYYPILSIGKTIFKMGKDEFDFHPGVYLSEQNLYSSLQEAIDSLCKRMKAERKSLREAETFLDEALNRLMAFK